MGRPQSDDELAVMTHAEIAAVLGISRARVGQLEAAALKKIRQRPELLNQLR